MGADCVCVDEFNVEWENPAGEFKSFQAELRKKGGKNMLDLLISHTWAIAILWAALYIFDYASTLWLAWCTGPP